MPDFSLENAITGKTCGLDEVGRGPLAGPVVAACVHIPEDVRTLPFISDIKDSKKLSWKKLEQLNMLIQKHCLWTIAESCPRRIEDINILQASLDAMRRAYETLCPNNLMHALVDGNKRPALNCSMQTVVKGDSISTSIAAASIIAKVARDRQMHKLAEQYPHYGWDSNVGYPSQKHRDAILKHGITEHHRKNFAPVRDYIESQSASAQNESETGSETRLRA